MLAGLAASLGGLPVHAEDPSPPAGLVVPIPQARISEYASNLTRTVEVPWKAFEARRKGGKPADPFRLICDFNPDKQPNRSENFGICLELAKRIKELQDKHGVHVIAYVHGEVSRHTVLPVLACSEIMMSENPPATLGKVADDSRALVPDDLRHYETYVKGRYPIALIRKMYERELIVVRVGPNVKDGDRYRDQKEAPTGVPEQGLGAADGAIAYTFEQARRLGLAQPDPRNTLDEVLTACRLPRSALYEAPAQLVICRTVLAGAVNGEMKEKLERRINRARDNKATVLIVQLECGDGDSDKAYQIALLLAGLSEKQENRIETIAYVTPQARNLATFLALSCNRVVMHSKARLGDFESYLWQAREREAGIRQNLAEIAGRKFYPEVLARGMVSRELRIHLIVRGGEQLLADDDELKARNDQAKREKKPEWEIKKTIKPANEDERNKYLTLAADSAVDLGLADTIADKPETIGDQLLGGAGQVKTIDGDFLEDVAEFLRHPMTSFVLVLIGFTCLILEVKMPGVGVPGVIAAVCFVLFVWSHSQISGEITWLAILLFLLGLVLLALEVFVLPGFGVAGISGILLVLGSLALIAYGHLPRTSDDWAIVGGKVVWLLGGMIGALFLAITLVRYLPNIPWANRIILHPKGEASESGEEGTDTDGINPELAELLGAIGVAATPLRPAGKSQFGDAFVDVVAEGGYIAPGTRVQVIEIEGNRVVVREV
jgi:membrane-bound ClpP family serine protease